MRGAATYTRRIATCLLLWASAALSTSCSVIEEQLPTYEETSLVGVGDKAPDFCTTSLDGKELSLSSAAGEVVMLILFSHECPDCKALLDELQTIIDGGEALPTTMAISRGGSEEAIMAYRDENGYTVDMAADSDKQIYGLYATMYVPRYYLIDEEGVIRMTKFEYYEGDLREMLDLAKEIRQ